MTSSEHITLALSFGSKRRMRLWLAWAAMQSSGMRTATQTAPFRPGPLPIISIIQASSGSAIEKTFALGGVAILRHERRHYLDGFARRLGALQTQQHETHVVYHPFRVGQFVASAERRLADGQLMFVDITNDAVRLGSLVDFTEVAVGVAIDDAALRAFGVLGRREAAQRAEHAVAVGVVGDDDRTVGRGFLSDYQARTGVGLRRSAQHEGRAGHGERSEKSCFHIPYI